MEKSGPLWAYWCWVMERYCSRLLRSVTSRKHPDASLNRRILETQTLHTIRDLFNLRESLPRYTLAHKPRPRIRWDTEDLRYSDLELIGPCRTLELNNSGMASLKSRIAVHVMTQNKVENKALVLSHLPATIEQWAKIQIKDGDTISSVHGDTRSEDNSRSATFCQYEVLVDQLAHNRQVQPVMNGKTFFGELERIFLLHLPKNSRIKQKKAETLALLDIRSCDVTQASFDFFEYRTFGSREVVDASALRALVGRIKNGSSWTFVRREGVFEHAVYLDEEEEANLSD